MIWAGRVVIILIGVLLLAAVILYGGSEALMRRQIPLDLPRIAGATDPRLVAEGARLARITGCISCHGPQGRILLDDPMVGRIVAPALARVAADANDGQLARAIRHGVGTKARSLYIMPTEALNHLSDADISLLVGWMRTLDEAPMDLVGGTSLGPLGRIAALSGRLPGGVIKTGGQPRQRPADIGRYLTEVSCGGCHALNEDRAEGPGQDVAPALAPMVAAYDPVALRTLLRTGTGMGGRPMKRMAQASREGLNALTDAEIAAIQAYLKRRAGPQTYL
jgi:mono/diheme cytochrome c family protein